MYKIIKKVFFLLIAALFLYSSTVLTAMPKQALKSSKDETDKIQRTPVRYFDLQQNTVSNFQFYTTNYGIFGLNSLYGVGGGYWPRGSLNQYVFGGGVWFGAVKNRPDSAVPKKYVEVTYNPNNGQSWMVPGRIEDGDLANQSDINSYRTYFSTDMRASDGKPLVTADGPAWPIWDDNPYPDTLKHNRYFGHYINDKNKRSTLTYPKGPSIISGEDVFSTYKDTDLNYYDGGFGKRKSDGYPLRLQFEQFIYSWGFGDYRDFIFLRYDIINYSKDTLMNCWLAPVMDCDISRAPLTSQGAVNDRVKYYKDEDTLNMAYQWTNTDQGEKGYGFGYLGFNFLESPAVDNQGFVRKDKKFYNVHEQLGLKTFRNWVISQDYLGDDERYNFMASRQKDGDDGPGDKRFMMATGPFNMIPGDTVRVVVGMIFALPAKFTEADGSTPDVQGLVTKVKFAQIVYDNNFRAPAPPDRGVFVKWTPLNNGIVVQWDSTSEISNDIYENGLDFLGYKLYRARRTDLDTFDINTVAGNTAYPSGKGPMGWKQLASWQLPTPFVKSSHRSGPTGANGGYPYIDSLKIIGPAFQKDTNGIYVKDGNNNFVIDTFALRVFRVGTGMILSYPDTYTYTLTGSQYVIPIILGSDTSQNSKPWGPYYNNLIQKGQLPIYLTPYKPESMHHELLDTICVGTIALNRALLTYNPLYWDKETVSINASDTVGLTRSGDTIYVKGSFKTVTINGVSTLIVDRLVPISNYLNSMRDSNRVRRALDSIYSYIQRGMAKVSFPDFESSPKTKKNIILPYMTQVTNNRTFIDIGDDNKNGIVEYSDDPTITEKLINNVDYYYKLLAYDEGDYSQPTPTKINDGSPGLPNLVTTNPAAAPAGNKVNFRIISVDSSMMGSLYNFSFYPIDPDRAIQQFQGDTLELQFQPYWASIPFLSPGNTTPEYIGLYGRTMIMTDITKNKPLYNSSSFFEESIYYGGVDGLFTENAKTFYSSDTVINDPVKGKPITFGSDPMNSEIVTRAGQITTGDFTQSGYPYDFGWQPGAYGTLGFSFYYSIQQQGGMLRPDSSSIVMQPNKVPVNLITASSPDLTKIFTTQAVGVVYVSATNGYPYYASFNNGPATYEVEFTAGGTETLNLVYGKPKKTNTFNVPYLNVKVRNVLTSQRPTEKGGTSLVSYPNELPHMVIDTSTAVTIPNLIPAPVSYPNPVNLGFRANDLIGKYNLSSYGWVNGRANNATLKLPAQQTNMAPGGTSIIKQNIGTQGRYYLSAISGTDTLDFVNEFMLSGCQFVVDYANKGRRFGTQSEWESLPTDQYVYGSDYKVGDKMTLKVSGGAFGLPLPGAKVRFVIDQAIPTMNNYTSNQLDQVTIVPNPYYLSSQAQKSPYDTRLWFTKLPQKCTIDIYTINGDLVKSITHDENISPSPDQTSVEIWDLLSKNKERIQSQTLVAIIKTANGASSVQKFSIVVGGNRIVPE